MYATIFRFDFIVFFSRPAWRCINDILQDECGWHRTSPLLRLNIWRVGAFIRVSKKGKNPREQQVLRKSNLLKFGLFVEPPPDEEESFLINSKKKGEGKNNDEKFVYLNYSRWNEVRSFPFFLGGGEGG